MLSGTSLDAAKDEEGAGILRFALNDTKINAEGGESARGILNRARKSALCEDPHLRSSPILGEGKSGEPEGAYHIEMGCGLAHFPTFQPSAVSG